MKYLHENKELFDNLIIRTSQYNGITTDIIRKDYFVYYLLKEIANNIPNIVFKGGTSLSKCFNLIDRYSEDIDLNFIHEEKMTDSKLQQFNRSLVSIIQNSGFTINNIDDLKSRRNSNTFMSEFKQDEQKITEIKVETSLGIPAYPITRKLVASYIYDFLNNQNKQDLIKEYNLEPFEINAQNIERTFIDKVFALCDYYERPEPGRNSRHIYDLYKLYPKIKINNEFNNLIKQVRTERQNYASNVNISAQDGYNVKQTLQKIIDAEFYKSDFKQVTSLLLYKPIDYDEIITVLNKIISDPNFKI